MRANTKLHNVLYLIHECYVAMQVESRGSRADFFAKRVAIAASNPTLSAFFETLVLKTDVELQKIKPDTFSGFLNTLETPEEASILHFIRENKSIVSMVTTQKQEILIKMCNESPVLNTKLKTIGEIGHTYPRPTPKIPIKITMHTGLSHGGDTKAGNNMLFRRESYLTDTGEAIELPFYSGAAFRGQMRDLIADHYLSSLGIKPNMSSPNIALWMFHVLYSGGSLAEGSSAGKAIDKLLGNNGTIKVKAMQEFRDMIPPTSLIGSALGNRIPPGRFKILPLIPHCKEHGNGDKYAHELFSWNFITRKEDHEGHEAGVTDQMIANTEILKPGTILDGGVYPSGHISDIELSCLGKGFELMQDSAFIGGQNAKGLGHCSIEIDNMPDSSIYEQYLKDNKDKILDYLGFLGVIK